MTQNLKTGLGSAAADAMWQQNGAKIKSAAAVYIAACDFPSVSPIMVLMIIFNYINLRHRYFNVTGVVVVRSRLRTLRALLLGGQVPRLVAARFEEAAE